MCHGTEGRVRCVAQRRNCQAWKACVLKVRATPSMRGAWYNAADVAQLGLLSIPGPERAIPRRWMQCRTQGRSRSGVTHTRAAIRQMAVPSKETWTQQPGSRSAWRRRHRFVGGEMPNFDVPRIHCCMSGTPYERPECWSSHPCRRLTSQTRPPRSSLELRHGTTLRDLGTKRPWKLQSPPRPRPLSYSSLLAKAAFGSR